MARLVTVLISKCNEPSSVPIQTIVTPVPMCKQCTSLSHFRPCCIIKFKLGLSLICSKFYLLFFPEFPKLFSYYFSFILVSSLLFHNNAHLVSVATVT